MTLLKEWAEQPFNVSVRPKPSRAPAPNQRNNSCLPSLTLSQFIDFWKKWLVLRQEFVTGVSEFAGYSDGANRLVRNPDLCDLTSKYGLTSKWVTKKILQNKLEHYGRLFNDLWKDDQLTDTGRFSRLDQILALDAELLGLPFNQKMVTDLNTTVLD